MEITSNSLQEVINKRAELKAKKEINILVIAIKNSGITNVKNCYTKEGDKTREIRYSIIDESFRDQNNILTKLYNEKVSEYIISETKDFIKKVESLAEQADNLLNIANNY